MITVQKDLVSFIIAAYNCRKYILDCVESCLRQSYSSIEVVITDDGSSDGTFNSLNENYSGNPKVKLFRFEMNRKKIAAFNNSFACASGEYIAIVGADDVNEPNRIEEQLKYMNTYDLTYCNLKQINNENDIVKENWLEKFHDSEISFESMLLTPSGVGSILMKRKIAETIFPMPETLPHEDWWIPLLASHENKIFFSSKPLYRYRIHGTNLSGLHSDYSHNKLLHLRQEIRDLPYYIHVRKYLESKNEKKYYNWMDFRIALLNALKEKLNRKNRTFSVQLQQVFRQINITTQQDIPVQDYIRVLLYFIDKFLYFGLWREAGVLLRNVPKTGLINIKEYKLAILLRYHSVIEFRKSYFCRLLKFLAYIKRRFIQ
ncbi:MAG: glycosyltransferase [Bacteroidetes bacterium]|nr:glycosyltransferase [Bacteroidota bacterium]